MLTHHGETRSISEWARRLGISRSALSKKINQNIKDGVKPEDALEPWLQFDRMLKKRLAEDKSELRSWRLSKGWISAAEAGEYLGLSGSALLMHERGDSPVSDITKRIIDYIDRYGPLQDADLPDSMQAWRIKHGWSDIEAAEMLGIHPITVWKYERRDNKHWRREKQLRRLMAYISMELSDRKRKRLR